jgi:hypothetical protein
MNTEFDKATTSLTLTSLIQRCDAGYRRIKPMLTWPRYVGATLILFWLYLLPFERGWFSRPALFPVWAMYTTLYLGAISFLLGKRLAKTASTLRQIRSPSSLWRYHLARTLLSLSLLTAVLCLAIDAVPIDKAFPHAFSSHNGLFYLVIVSPIASLAMLFVLSDQGLLHRFWRRGILLAIGLAVVALLIAIFWPMVDAAPKKNVNINFQIHISIGIALALTWPVLASILWLRWRTAVPLTARTKHVSSTQNDDAGLGANWLLLLQRKAKPYTDHLHRFVSLYIIRSRKYSVKLTPAYLLFQWLSIGFIPVVAYGLCHVIRQQQVTGEYVVFQFISIPWVSFALVGKDLNWRNWLVPSGIPRHNLGAQLLKTNQFFYGSSVVVFAFIALLIYVIKTKPTLATLGEAIWQFRAAPLEISLGIALAVFIRGISRFSPILFGLFTLIGLFLLPQSWLSAPLFPLDYRYLASLIVLNLIAFALVNKVWTVSKVLPVISKQSEANTQRGARHG